jgi:translation initiation factor IF-1
VAHAEDVAVFVTRREDFRVIRDAIQHYEKASGARLDIQKSKALTVGGWTGTEIDLGMDFDSNMRIVGVAFSNTKKGQHITAGRERPHKLTPRISKHMHQTYIWRNESDMCTVHFWPLSGTQHKIFPLQRHVPGN